MEHFWAELRRRKVPATGAIYLAAAWVILQVSTVVGPILSAPEWLPTFTFWLLAIGFPLSLILAWFFDITKEGIKSDPARGHSLKPGHGLSAVAMILLLSAAGLGQMLNAGQARSDALFSQQRAYASLAVLPFRSFSNEEDRSYFSEGLAERVLNKLSEDRALSIAGRASSFTLAGQSKDARDLGSALNVNFLLDGSVRRSGDTLLVSIQLLETTNGRQIWSEDFETTLADPIHTENHLATNVTAALSEELVKQGIAKIKPKDPEAIQEIDPKVYDLFLRAKAMSHTPDLEKDQATKLKEKRGKLVAITELAPDFVDGWLALAEHDAFMSERFAGDVSSMTALKNALAALEKAEALAPNSARVLATRGTIYWGVDNRKAEPSLVKAVTLNPNLAKARALLSRIYFLNEKPIQAFAEAEAAYALDPLGEHPRLRMAYVYAYRGQFERANQLLLSLRNDEGEDLYFPGGLESTFHAMALRHDLVSQDGATLSAWISRNVQGDMSGAGWMNYRLTQSALTLQQPDLAREHAGDLALPLLDIAEGNYEAAVARVHTFFERDPKELPMGLFPFLAKALIQAEVRRGNWPAILEAVEKTGWTASLEAPPSLNADVSPSSEINIAHAFQMSGNDGRALDWLGTQRQTLEDRLTAGLDNPHIHYDYGRILLLLGEEDQGFAELEKAFDMGWCWWLTPTEPIFAKWKDDPRMIALMDRHAETVATQKQAFLKAKTDEQPGD